jgi:pSer/pThr/pTyr-binding forkhead associated (FHA) protein
VHEAPSYYGFRIGTSPIVLLDRAAQVGRRPSLPRVTRGALRLVRVISPTGEVSASHLELRQVGLSVVATDLRSTNGTRVGLPGQPIRRLRDGESVVVTPGTVIDIGDSNVIEILPLQAQEPSVAS